MLTYSLQQWTALYCLSGLRALTTSVGRAIAESGDSENDHSSYGALFPTTAVVEFGATFIAVHTTATGPTSSHNIYIYRKTAQKSLSTGNPGFVSKAHYFSNSLHD